LAKPPCNISTFGPFPNWEKKIGVPFKSTTAWFPPEGSSGVSGKVNHGSGFDEGFAAPFNEMAGWANPIAPVPNSVPSNFRLLMLMRVGPISASVQQE
jgi:hypothetical protein